MRKQENEWEKMNENDAHLCLDYNRTKHDSKNYKNEWEIRGTDITLSHPVRIDYAENPEIVL